MTERDALPNVSRETMERLRHFEALVAKWTKKINLVSRQDAEKIWSRHILDSVQIFDVAPAAGHWLDIGSGGGFPGIVAAVLAKEEDATRAFTLVDSDQRKCAFLRTAARELDLNVTVHASRIDEMEPQNASVLSARALDDLSGLLLHAHQHLAPDGVALFPKGARWREEDAAARKEWSYDLEPIKSKTNPDAIILKIKELARV
ncbi:16S rRNA (guanine(527)-N(7))-methyltransferase RsmG [Sulfitobacter sp. HNIBRBA3233]|uniref:16S rRNA (guanine(527)-N(7))-methyltransferase RsmG n=1 Tax=Sulfitobacter marinivivus TaxID=3158558 RepID=UPI0032DFD09E